MLRAEIQMTQTAAGLPASDQAMHAHSSGAQQGNFSPPTAQGTQMHVNSLHHSIHLKAVAPPELLARKFIASRYPTLVIPQRTCISNVTSHAVFFPLNFRLPLVRFVPNAVTTLQG